MNWNSGPNRSGEPLKKDAGFQKSTTLPAAIMVRATAATNIEILQDAE
jgi:hypothetical protein